MTRWKWAANAVKQEKWTIEKFINKTWKTSEAVVAFSLLIRCSGNFRKSLEKCPETCSVTNNPITLFHFCSFPKITKKLLFKAIKRLTEMESMKEKMSCDLWFPLTHTKVNLKQLSEKFVSVKINYLKRASAAKFYSGIRRCFRKHLKMGLYYLIAESVILQYCFYQQPY